MLSILATTYCNSGFDFHNNLTKYTLREEIFAEFNFADEQMSNFQTNILPILTLISQRKKKIKIRKIKFRENFFRKISSLKVYEKLMVF